MPVIIHQKEYTTVAERVSNFRSDEKYVNFSIESEIIVNNAEIVVMKSTIKDENGRIVSAGHAEEVRGSTKINKTSALENCETSAIGRALAALNFGGEQLASANEVSDAIIQQAQSEISERFIAQTSAINNNIESIVAIKGYLANGEYSLAAEAMAEITDSDKQALNIASTKGGIWTLEDMKHFKSEEYQQARTAYYTKGE